MTTESFAAGPIKAGLDAKKASARAHDALRSATNGVRSTLASAARFARLDKVKGIAEVVIGYVGKAASKAKGLLGYFGWVNLAGTVLTAGSLRDAAWKAGAKAYAAVTWPIRKVASLLTWPLRRFERTAAMVAVAAGSVAWCEDWASNQLRRVFDYLDSKETSTVMIWLRTGFQTRVLAKVIRLVLPKLPAWLAFGLAALAPVFGMRKSDLDAMDDAPAVAKGALGFLHSEDVTAEEIAKTETPSAKALADPEIKKEATMARLTMDWKGMPKDSIITLTSWVDPKDGVRCYSYDGTTYRGELSMSHLELGSVVENPNSKPAPKATKAAPVSGNRSTRRGAGQRSAQKA